MQRRSEVCKQCRHAAICFGLGMQVVLQTIADTHAGWEGSAVNEAKWEKDHEQTAWSTLRSNIPDACPDYTHEDWYVCFERNGDVSILRAADLKEIPGAERLL